jgi:CRP-like cAMP-binding protein
MGTLPPPLARRPPLRRNGDDPMLHRVESLLHREFTRDRPGRTGDVTSTLFAGVHAERVTVLDEDAELAGRLRGERRATAQTLSVARILRLGTGTWDAGNDAEAARDGFGLLIVEGMLVRRVGYDGRYGAELLGPGDLVRPWEHDGEQAVLPFDAHWRVLSDMRLALLDLAWARRMGPYPEIAAELLSRSHRRSRRLAVMMAISQQPRLDEALELFFWELADRYGRVRADGVHVGVSLTHEQISYLVGARRPSVSTALGRLSRDGRLERIGREWVLTGQPPTRSPVELP